MSSYSIWMEPANVRPWNDLPDWNTINFIFFNYEMSYTSFVQIELRSRMWCRFVDCRERRKPVDRNFGATPFVCVHLASPTGGDFSFIRWSIYLSVIWQCPLSVVWKSAVNAVSGAYSRAMNIFIFYFFSITTSRCTQVREYACNAMAKSANTTIYIKLFCALRLCTIFN